MEEIEIVSPVDGGVFSTLAATTKMQAYDALALARRAQADWAGTSLEDRIKICKRFVQAMVQNTDAISEDLTWQMGRPIKFSPKEIAGLVERSDAMISAAKKGLQAHELAESPHSRRIERVPHGIVLVIAPWNYPFLTAINTILAALLAGNAVILKPGHPNRSNGAAV